MPFVACCNMRECSNRQVLGTFGCRSSATYLQFHSTVPTVLSSIPYRSPTEGPLTESTAWSVKLVSGISLTASYWQCKYHWGTIWSCISITSIEHVNIRISLKFCQMAPLLISAGSVHVHVWAMAPETAKPKMTKNANTVIIVFFITFLLNSKITIKELCHIFLITTNHQ